MVDDAVDTFLQEDADDHRLLAKAVVQRFDTLVEDECERLMSRLDLDETTAAEVTRSMARIANKLRHPLLSAVRNASDDQTLDMVRSLIADGTRDAGGSHPVSHSEGDRTLPFFLVIPLLPFQFVASGSVKSSGNVRHDVRQTDCAASWSRSDA